MCGVGTAGAGPRDPKLPVAIDGRIRINVIFIELGVC